MLKAVIFDLDGTLVQTEKLKALSYARATVELCPYTVEEAEVIEAFKDAVGLSRQEAAQVLIDRFDLQEHARQRMAEFEVDEPWQAFVQIRLKYYNDLLANPKTLKNHVWPHNLDLLHTVRDEGCKVALATMSHREQVQRVLSILGLEDAFDFVATRDDVVNGKPDPEIYNLVARRLDVDPGYILVIEDSPTGVKAAKAAGMNVLAVSTDFTRDKLREGDILAERWIVDDPNTLPEVVRQCIVEIA